MGEYHECL
jgi:hypothetical protein